MENSIDHDDLDNENDILVELKIHIELKRWIMKKVEERIKILKDRINDMNFSGKRDSLLNISKRIMKNHKKAFMELAKWLI